VEVLKETGPLAVSSANLSGHPPARNADEAEKMLGDSVSVYLDGGVSGHADPSTILDLTGPVPRVLRAGAIPLDKIRAVVGVLLTDEDEPDEPAEAASAPEPAKPSLTKDAPAEARETSAEAPAEPAKPSLAKGEGAAVGGLADGSPQTHEEFAEHLAEPAEPSRTEGDPEAPADAAVQESPVEDERER
jgi:hypothetical protein